MVQEYYYGDARPTWSNAYVWPTVLEEIRRITGDAVANGGVFELGCGNGATAGMLAARGFSVTGVDASKSGIEQARAAFPECQFDVASAYDDLAAAYGQFPLVLSLEVVEHLFDPRCYVKRLFELVTPGGTVIISTPYHGYAKNLALAITGKLDSHFTALWDGGHIKFFSIKTLRILLADAGFVDIRFHRVGRVPIFAKSMVAVARRRG